MPPEDTSAEAAQDLTFRELIDAAPDAMLVADQAGLIVFANLQTERDFGYPREELLGRTLEVLVPERFRAGHSAHVD